MVATHRRRPVRPDRRVRGAQGHELHRPRPLARHLRRLRGERPARGQLPPRRRRLGRRLGADDRRRDPAAGDRVRRRHRRHHHGLVRPRPRAVRALRAPGGELRRRAVREHPRRQQRGRDRHRRASPRRPPPSSSSATGRCCSRPSTPRWPTRPASGPPAWTRC